jgi:hypothetical protein
MRLVAIAGYGTRETPLRKVAAVIGPSRSPGKVRAAIWSQSSQSWSTVRALEESRILGPAPKEWRQTRAALAALGDLDGR